MNLSWPLITGALLIQCGFTALSPSFASASTDAGPAFKFTPPAPWQPAKLPEVNASWLIPNSPTKATLTVTTQSDNDGFEVNHLGEEKIIKMVEWMRSSYFGIFGITDWKVDQHRVVGPMIEMIGHYKSSSGNPVHFIERDYFLGKSAYTVSFFEDVVGSANQSDAKISALLDQFKPMETK